MSSSPMRRWQHGDGPYAMITGATAGMGEEWALQLAALGFNIVLHGRSQTKLDNVASRIHAASPDTDVKIVRIDVSEQPIDYKPLDAVLSQGIRLTVLINNVAVNDEGFPLFEELEPEAIEANVTANATFPVVVGHKCMPVLRKNQPSLMINISSIGAWAPGPFLSVYVGAKAFNVAWSHGLYNEMHHLKQEVDVVVMMPGQVVSNMVEGPATLDKPTSANWVSWAIYALSPGWFSSRPGPIITPWPSHAIGAAILGVLPQWLGDHFTRNIVVKLKAHDRRHR